MERILIFMFLVLNTAIVDAQVSFNDSIQLSQDRTLKNISRNFNRLVNEVARFDSIKLPMHAEANIKADTVIAFIDSNSIQKLKEKKGFSDLLYKSFGNLFSAMVGGIIALFVFYRRWKKERDKEIEEKARIINEKNDYMKSVLKAVIGLSEKYKSAVEEFTKKIRARPIDIPDIALYPLQEFGRLQKIVDNEQYFHAYLKKYGNTEQTLDNFRTIASLTDYLNSQSAELFKKDYKIRDYKRKIRYVKLFQEILEESSEFGESSEKTNKNIFDDIASILESYMQHKKENLTNLEYHQTKFIEPVRDLILSKYYDINELKIILGKISRAVQLYNEISYQNMNVVMDFENFQKTMDEVIARLKKESENILN